MKEKKKDRKEGRKGGQMKERTNERNNEQMNKRKKEKRKIDFACLTLFCLVANNPNADGFIIYYIYCATVKQNTIKQS